MENDQESAATPGVTRGQNQLHVLPEDWQTAASVIEPWLDRIEPGSAEAASQLLVITSDAEGAAGVASRLAPLAQTRNVRVFAATDTRRAVRLQRAAPAQVVVAPPMVFVELLQSATLKVSGVRAVVLAWVDDLGLAATRALETVMAELPKEAARVVLAASMTPAVEQLVERYARRAHRMQAASNDPLPPVSLSYIAVGDVARPMALRRLLDALDPESAFIVTRGAESRKGVEAQLRSLGYGGEASTVRAGDAQDGAVQLIVLYDIPPAEDQLRRLVAGGGAARVVALVAPRQVATMRRMAGGAVTPLGLPEAAARARSREDSLRDELRQVLTSGHFSRELLSLEPLLSEFDGAEVAAAALRLLDAERSKPQAITAASASPAMTRLYVNVGEMDNVRPGDLVGAVTNEAGISKAEMGRVEIRERHSTVEVATAVANAVVAKLNGVTIRGRRALVKVDEDRGDRGDRGGAPRRDRGAPPRDRGGPPRKRPARRS